MKVINFNEIGNLESGNLHRGRVARRANAKILATTLVFISALCATQVGSLIINNVSAEEVANTAFQVNVVDSLSVSITTPTENASGNVGDFLRNDVNLSVTSNNANGFTASMYSGDNTTDLVNATSGNAEILATLDGTYSRANFPANHWGYSLGAGNINSSMNNNSYGETGNGNGDSNYYPLVSNSATPITILTSDTAATSSQDIYFGAKSSTTQAAGTYTGTVVISVVTGAISESNPITPTNPATPNTDTIANDNQATYTGSTGTGATVGGGTNGVTAYTVRTTSYGGAGGTGTGTGTGTGASEDTTTTTTQVTEGDTTSSYPLGVINHSSSQTFSNIGDSNSLATGLAIASAAAATSGTIFFLLAKRKKDDDEEEENKNA